MRWSVNSEALLPCPFCGGEAKLYEVGLKPDYGYIVGCADCEGQAGDTDEPWLQAGHAIAAWNRRTATARQEDAP